MLISAKVDKIRITLQSTEFSYKDYRLLAINGTMIRYFPNNTKVPTHSVSHKFNQLIRGSRFEDASIHIFNQSPNGKLGSIHPRNGCPSPIKPCVVRNLPIPLRCLTYYSTFLAIIIGILQFICK